MQNGFYQGLASFVARQVRRLSRRLKGVREGTDPEDIHQARVACRRLRASLRQLREVLPRELTRGHKLRKLRRQIRTFAQALGEARDLDVQAGRFETLAATELPPEAKPALDWIIRRLRFLRRDLQKQVSDAVDWLEDRTVLSRLTDWVNKLSRAQASQTEIEQVVSKSLELIGQEVQEAQSQANEALAQSNPESLHAFRIAVKRLRYTLELWEEIAPKTFSDAISQCRQWQELLGTICDSTVGERLLQQLRSEKQGQKERQAAGSASEDKLAPGFHYVLLFCHREKQAAEEKLRALLREAEQKGFWTGLSKSLNLQTLLRQLTKQ
jgi:CHAD domain-containing protein